MAEQWLDGTTGSRTAAQMMRSDKPPGSGTSLPTLPDTTNYPTGALFCRTTDFTLWRSNGSGWDAITATPGSGSVSNTTVAANAAIAYSKLNLSTSIVNGDVAANAAVAYSKLALTGSIVNADVSGSAAIDAAKVALPTPYGFSNDRDCVINSGSAPGINQIRLMRYTVEATRSYTDMTVFLTAAATGNMVAGIYDCSATNLNLLGTTASVAVGAINTWQTGLTFTSSVPLTLGQDVFIVVHTDNSTSAFGRTNVAANTAVSQLPSGYIRGNDASGFNWCNFNRGSYSAPLPNTISVASLTSNAGGFVFWIK